MTNRKNRRHTLLIEPHFQTRLILRLTGWVALATALTAAALFGYLEYAERTLEGDFFFVVQQAGSHPEMMSLPQIVLPALGAALALNLLITLVFALYYSQKLAGPVHRLIDGLMRLERGEPMKPQFRLRSSDEFQDVGLAFEALLKRLSEQGYLKEPK